jgi:hypothetical protein
LGERAAYRVVVRERPNYRQNSAQRLREMLPPHGGERVTTEIAIMNRQAIALAADSAVTIGRQRVWKNANKLFSLAPFNDIAIMANGSGEFVGFPWETIIKSYRLKVGRRAFQTVDACAKDFISFLRSGPFNNIGLEKVSINYLFVKEIERLRAKCCPDGPKGAFRDALRGEINNARGKAEKQNIVLHESLDAVFSADILQFCNETFKCHIPKGILKSIEILCGEIYRRSIVSGAETGLAFAGFGSDEYFPSLISYIVDGKYNTIVRAWYDEESSHDINEQNASEGVIVPFGQYDIATLFLEGIASSHLRWMRAYAKKVLKQKSDQLIKDYVKDDSERVVEAELQKKSDDIIISEFTKEFDSYKDKSLVQPIMKVVSSLPKEEMAIMAESLVELTALRRRVDSPVESVGGPIDVMIISKGDGLVWIKRKHYFDISFNRDFAIRKDVQMKGAVDERETDAQIDGANSGRSSDIGKPKAK